MRFEDCAVIEYAQAWDKQKVYFEALLEKPETAEEVVMMCEHPHVYTLGKSGCANNLLVNDDFLKKIGATYFKTDRGGDITYHGYGQLVVYPILNLTKHNLSLKDYIYKLEQTIIETVAEFGIQSDRLEGATGVWIKGRSVADSINDGVNVAGSLESEGLRKIAAIGVKASRYVTMHGIALNVTTDLTYFNHINPCGFVDKGVTSIAKETGREIEMESVKKVFEDKFLTNFAI